VRIQEPEFRRVIRTGLLSPWRYHGRSNRTSEAMRGDRTITNALTVDVEDYFHIHAFSSAMKYSDWDDCECFVEESTGRVMDILDEYAAKATFFVLGWVAERYPGLVKEISCRGHEVACHGYAHQRIFDQTRKQFEQDLARAKGNLEELIGTEVIGYRAPTYSIGPDTLWALGCLRRKGFLYDSSIFPIKHDYYGFPQAPRFPFLLDRPEGPKLLDQIVNPKYISLNGKTSACPNSGVPGELEYSFGALQDRGLVEWPLSTVRLLGRNVPCAGGGYFRIYPYALTRWLIRSLNMAGRPVIFYIHPWEFNLELPRVNNLTLRQQFRTYHNLDKTEARFRRLLTDFCFSSVRDLLGLHK
jgi:polysaccharide deacetylase family protein (PEP-CTERM system associated)